MEVYKAEHGPALRTTTSPPAWVPILSIGCPLMQGLFLFADSISKF
jgi:hypothetical protein